MQVLKRKGRPRFPLLVGLLATIALTLAASAFAIAPTTTASVRLIRVTSPASAGSNATLTAQVSGSRTACSIAVYYKSGPSRAQGLYSKRTVNGRVSWTWMVGTRTTPGRWPISVACGAAGSLRTSFLVR